MALGFELFAKGAKIGQSKHIRVRPRFNAWSASGTITVFDDSMEDRLRVTMVATGLGSPVTRTQTKPLTVVKTVTDLAALRASADPERGRRRQGRPLHPAG